MVARMIATAKLRESGVGEDTGQQHRQFSAIRPHNRQDRSQLNRDREDAARIGVTEQPLAQEEMRRGRHGQKFRDALHHPEHRCSKKIHAASGRLYDARALRCFDRPAGGVAGAAGGPRRVRGGARRAFATPEAHHGRGDEHAGVRARNDAHHHREGKAVQHFAAEEEQRQRRQQRGARGDDGTAEGLVDRHVDHVIQLVPPHRPEVLADPVEDDDRVVGGEAGDRQNRRDDVQAHVIAEERQERQRDEQVVNRGDHRAHAEAQLEPRAQVDQQADEREHRGVQTLGFELTAHRGADNFRALPLESAEVSFAQRVFHLRGGGAERRAGFRTHLRHTDHHLPLRRIPVRLHHGILAAPRIVAVERVADLLHRRRAGRTAR